MSILRKSLAAIAIEDIQDLVDSGSQENSELEFKGALPFRRTKGQTATADRWIEHGDRLGDYARDEILAEVVAFANAEGGTVVLGVSENDDEPRRAMGLSALPNCEQLAQRLLSAAEDVIEPRLPIFEVRSFPMDEDGNGIVLLRVAKSVAGPHRLTSTREFYVRRGERTSRMPVREVKDLTLALARTGDRIEALFKERSDAAATRMRSLPAASDLRTSGPLIVRVSAIPTAPQSIPHLTSRRDLWWSGREFTAQIDGQPYRCGYPAREFSNQPKTRLRSLIADVEREMHGPARLLRDDGLVEFLLVHARRERPQLLTSEHDHVYAGWLLGLVAGAFCQIEHLRRSLAWDTVPYGLEIELLSQRPLTLRWHDHDWSSRLLESPSATLPRYAVGAAAEFDELIGQFIEDIMNTFGSDWRGVCSIPWEETLR